MGARDPLHGQIKDFYARGKSFLLHFQSNACRQSPGSLRAGIKCV